MADSSKNAMSTVSSVPKAGSAEEAARRPGIIRFWDIVLTVRILLSLPIAWIVPPRHWAIIGRVIAHSALVLPLERWRFYAKRIDSMLASSGSNATNRQVLVDSLVERQNKLFHILRAHQPGRWHPAIRVEGEDNFRSALAQGRGVILWVTPFIHSTLVTKKGLSDAGFAVHQLSRPNHGFSDTQFGRSVLNPILTSVENLYLAQRVVIAPGEGGGATALATLRQVIADKGIVSITVGCEARRTEDIPFLGGRVRIATGPIHLARTTGAALLPVFTCQDDNGVFQVTVDRELSMSKQNTDPGVYRELTEEYFQRLRPYVLKFPSQWDGNIRKDGD